MDDAFELTVMVHPGLGIGLDEDRPGPDLMGADAGMVDCRLPEHARRLGGVGGSLLLSHNPI